MTVFIYQLNYKMRYAVTCGIYLSARVQPCVCKERHSPYETGGITEPYFITHGGHMA